MQSIRLLKTRIVYRLTMAAVDRQTEIANELAETPVNTLRYDWLSFFHAVQGIKISLLQSL